MKVTQNGRRQSLYLHMTLTFKNAVNVAVNVQTEISHDNMFIGIKRIIQSVTYSGRRNKERVELQQLQCSNLQLL